MKNSKGQALVEFVIVVPILIFVMMAMIDIGNIVIHKIRLEDNLNTIVSLYQDKNFSAIQNIAANSNFNFSYDSKQNIKILTPFLNLIIGNNYTIETKRIIYEE